MGLDQSPKKKPKKLPPPKRQLLQPNLQRAEIRWTQFEPELVEPNLRLAEVRWMQFEPEPVEPNLQLAEVRWMQFEPELVEPNLQLAVARLLIKFEPLQLLRQPPNQQLLKKNQLQHQRQLKRSPPQPDLRWIRFDHRVGSRGSGNTTLKRRYGSPAQRTQCPGTLNTAERDGYVGWSK